MPGHSSDGSEYRVGVIRRADAGPGLPSRPDRIAEWLGNLIPMRAAHQPIYIPATAWGRAQMATRPATSAVRAQGRGYVARCVGLVDVHRSGSFLVCLVVVDEVACVHVFAERNAPHHAVIGLTFIGPYLGAPVIETAVSSA